MVRRLTKRPSEKRFHKEGEYFRFCDRKGNEKCYLLVKLAPRFFTFVDIATGERMSTKNMTKYTPCGVHWHRPDRKSEFTLGEIHAWLESVLSSRKFVMVPVKCTLEWSWNE